MCTLFHFIALDTFVFYLESFNDRHLAPEEIGASFVDDFARTNSPAVSHTYIETCFTPQCPTGCVNELFSTEIPQKSLPSVNRTSICQKAQFVATLCSLSLFVLPQHNDLPLQRRIVDSKSGTND